MKRPVVLFLILASFAVAAERRAKNVILFLGDAGGIPTLNAASLYAHKQPQKLFIQSMPHIALMDTSSANSWVTDSAAGMSAIMTGQKTNNGVISQGPDTVRGQKDGAILKTVLEEAEERGLSTGVISNMSMADATPAACYAHSNDRKKTGEIFAQILKPRYGDGVDLVLGAGRKAIYEATGTMGIDLETALKEHGYATADSPDAIPDSPRVVALFNGSDYDLQAVVDRAVKILSRNPKGFFLMVECDMHTSKLKIGLDRVVTADSIIRQTAERMTKNTLVLFTADHSFDLRITGGNRGEDIFAEPTNAKQKPLHVNGSHTGEEVLVAAGGPGSGRVKGFIANTDLYGIMRAAYGWPAAASNAVAAGGR